MARRRSHEGYSRSEIETNRRRFAKGQLRELADAGGLGDLVDAGFFTNEQIKQLAYDFAEDRQYPLLMIGLE